MSRRVALAGWLLALPVLVLGGALARLVVPAGGDLHRPLAWALAPLKEAWLADRDGATFAVLLVQGGLLLLLASAVGGTLMRMAAVRLATGNREGVGAALSFGLGRAPRLALARAFTLLLVVAPLGLLFLLAQVGPGAAPWWKVALAVPLAVVLLGAFLAVAAGGFAPGPAIAAEDVGARAAVARAGVLVGAGPLRTLGLRLRGALLAVLGALPAFLVRAGLLGLLVLALHLFDPGGLRRALAVLQAGGLPDDASRWGVGGGHVALAGLLALGAAAVLLFTLADLSLRVVRARVALFLRLREEVQHVPPDHLHPPPQDPRHRGAEAAGFRRVATL